MPLLRILLTVAVVAYAAVAAGTGLDRMSRTAPALERSVPAPFRAQADRSAALTQMVRQDPAAALQHARAAVASDPIDPDATAVLGAAFSGNIKGRPMIDRGPDERQPERDVDRFAEGEAFDRNQPLIVIAGDDDLEVAACSARKHGISRMRTANIDAITITASFDRRNHFGCFFIPEESTFSAVWIDGGDGDARPGKTIAPQFAIDEADQSFKILSPNESRNMRQRNMRGQ